jgi:putative transposase
MPKHIHGILVLTDTLEINSQSPVRAGLAENLWADPNLGAKPTPTNHHGIPEIIRGFKTVSARSVNKRRKATGTPVWQRNYYEHIIRNEQSLQAIRQYIYNNPRSWQNDPLHPDYPSKR